MSDVNKVVYGNDTLIDLTNDTVTEDDVLEGVSFHSADGSTRTGKVVVADVIDNLESTSTTDALSANQGRVILTELTKNALSVSLPYFNYTDYTIQASIAKLTDYVSAHYPNVAVYVSTCLGVSDESVWFVNGYFDNSTSGDYKHSFGTTVQFGGSAYQFGCARENNTVTMINMSNTNISTDSIMYGVVPLTTQLNLLSTADYNLSNRITNVETRTTNVENLANDIATYGRVITFTMDMQFTDGRAYGWSIDQVIILSAIITTTDLTLGLQNYCIAISTLNNTHAFTLVSNLTGQIWSTTRSINLKISYINLKQS